MWQVEFLKFEDEIIQDMSTFKTSIVDYFQDED